MHGMGTAAATGCVGTPSDGHAGSARVTHSATAAPDRADTAGSAVAGHGEHAASAHDHTDSHAASTHGSGPEPATAGAGLLSVGSGAGGGHDVLCVATLPNRVAVATGVGLGTTLDVGESAAAVEGLLPQLGRFAGLWRGPPVAGFDLLVQLCISVR